MNETVAQVIDVIVENRRRFEEFCYSLSDEQLGRSVPDSSWIVKDFASHLATLDVTFANYVESVEAGGKIDLSRDTSGGSFDLDRWNDEQVEQRRSWSIQEIFGRSGDEPRAADRDDEPADGRTDCAADALHGPEAG